MHAHTCMHQLVSCWYMILIDNSHILAQYFIQMLSDRRFKTPLVKKTTHFWSSFIPSAISRHLSFNSLRSDGIDQWCHYVYARERARQRECVCVFFFHLRAHNQHVDYSGAYNWGCSLWYWSGIKGIRMGEVRGGAAMGGGGGGYYT